MWNNSSHVFRNEIRLLEGSETWTKSVLKKPVPVTYFNSPRGFQAPNPALITAESPRRRSKQSSRYQTGTTYRNWLDYFSHSATAAHSARRLSIWAGWSGGPHCFTSFTTTLTWQKTTLNAHFKSVAKAPSVKASTSVNQYDCLEICCSANYGYMTMMGKDAKCTLSSLLQSRCLKNAS